MFLNMKIWKSSFEEFSGTKIFHHRTAWIAWGCEIDQIIAMLCFTGKVCQKWGTSYSHVSTNKRTGRMGYLRQRKWNTTISLPHPICGEDSCLSSDTGRHWQWTHLGDAAQVVDTWRQRTATNLPTSNPKQHKTRAAFRYQAALVKVSLLTIHSPVLSTAMQLTQPLFWTPWWQRLQTVHGYTWQDTLSQSTNKTTWLTDFSIRARTCGTERLHSWTRLGRICSNRTGQGWGHLPTW